MAASPAVTLPARAGRPARPGPRPVACHAPRPQLRVVPPPRRAGRYLVAGVVLLAAAVFGVVTLNALAAEAAFTARELEREVDDLSVRYDELTAEVARLASPDRVHQVAVAELGMVPAAEPAFVEVPALRAGRAPAGGTAVASVAEPSGPALGAGGPSSAAIPPDEVRDPLKPVLSAGH